MSDQQKILLYERQLRLIRDYAREWGANQMGGVSIQRRRWKRLGSIADIALQDGQAQPETNAQPHPALATEAM